MHRSFDGIRRKKNSVTECFFSFHFAQPSDTHVLRRLVVLGVIAVVVIVIEDWNE